MLCKGLKFCPTPVNYNFIEEKQDIHQFCRKLKLTEYFDGVVYDDNSLVKPKSNFNPPDGRNNFLDKITSFLKETPKATQKQCTNYNITKNERDAINSLKINTDIIIKEADKGSAVVLMDSDFYKEKIEEIINDENYYEELTENRDKDIMKNIFKLVSSFSNELTEKEFKFLTKFDYKTSNFYGLPKVHKSNIIKLAVEQQKSEIITVWRPQDLKLRPIVAGPVCPTHRLSNLIDVLLQPMIPSVKAWVRDDLHILSKLPTFVEDDYEFATFDVEALYTNINHELGLQAVKYWLMNERKTDRISNDFILKVIQFILENNTFHFNDKYYRQVRGTAMGTKMAVAYATLTLGFLEIKLYEEIKYKYNDNVYVYFKGNYFRFLDDVFMIYNVNDTPLDDISKLLNELDVNLNFKLEATGSKVNFLDICVYKKENNKIETDIFYKLTDTKQYLDFYSSHPRHIKIALPYNLARRICTIVSDTDIKYERLDELTYYLNRCNYPRNLIADCIKKALSFDRSELINKTTSSQINDNNDENNIITYVSTYNPKFHNNLTIVKETFSHLKINDTTKDIFRDKELLVSKRQPANLKNLLTGAKFTTEKKTGVEKCNTSRCKLCSIIITGETFYFKKCDYLFKIKELITCDVLNCIYVLGCKGCDMIYIGETNNFRLRTNLHRDHSNKNIGLGVSRHIHNCTSNVNIVNKFYIMPFYKLHTDDIIFRKEMEAHFIKKFTPELNCCK